MRPKFENMRFRQVGAKKRHLKTSWRVQIFGQSNSSLMHDITQASCRRHMLSNFQPMKSDISVGRHVIVNGQLPFAREIPRSRLRFTYDPILFKSFDVFFAFFHVNITQSLLRCLQSCVVYVHNVACGGRDRMASC